MAIVGYDEFYPIPTAAIGLALSGGNDALSIVLKKRLAFRVDGKTPLLDVSIFEEIYREHIHAAS